jgi:hypothetical protein
VRAGRCLSARFFDTELIQHFIWFENAAHMIPSEAPDEYADAHIHRVLKETRGK